jgi:hypothetical protein
MNRIFLLGDCSACNRPLAGVPLRADSDATAGLHLSRCVAPAI